MMKASVPAAIALAMAFCGCSGGSGPSTAPNQPTLNASSSLITVDSVGGAPTSGITVTLSTGLSGTTPTGVITSQTTDVKGQTTFSNLPPTGQLCVSAVTGSGNSLQQTGNCAQPFPPTFTLTF